MLAALAGAPQSAATPRSEPEASCSGQEHERLHGLLRWLVTAHPPPNGSIGSWINAGAVRTYFGRHGPEVALEVAVFTTRAPAPGDGFDSDFGDDAREPIARREGSTFFDRLAVPPRLALHRLDAATLRPPRPGEVSVRVRTRGCYGVLLLHR